MNLKSEALPEGGAPEALTKHLDRYVREFAGRQNIRDLDTIDMMRVLVRGVVGKRLRYRDLIADNVLPSGARNA